MTTIYELLEKEKFYFKMLEIIKRARDSVCTFKEGQCLSCDARELLKEMEKAK